MAARIEILHLWSIVCVAHDGILLQHSHKLLHCELETHSESSASEVARTGSSCSCDAIEEMLRSRGGGAPEVGQDRQFTRSQAWTTSSLLQAGEGRARCTALAHRWKAS